MNKLFDFSLLFKIIFKLIGVKLDN